MKKKQLFWIKLTAGSLVVLVLVAGGYFSARYFREAQVVLPTVTPTPIITPTVVAIPVDTTGWKTYTNTKFGYSYMYPGSFELEQDPFEPLMEDQSLTLSNTITTPKSLAGLSGVRITIDSTYVGRLVDCLGEISCTQKFKEVLRLSIIRGYKKIAKEPGEIFMDVQRKIGNRIINGFAYTPPPPPNYWDEVYFISNQGGRIFKVTVTILLDAESKAAVDPIIDAILGTFKFTK